MSARLLAWALCLLVAAPPSWAGPTLDALEGMSESKDLDKPYDGGSKGSPGTAVGKGGKSAKPSLTLGKSKTSSDLKSEKPPEPTAAQKEKERGARRGAIKGSIIGGIFGFITGAITAWAIGVPLLAVIGIGAAVAVGGALIGRDAGKACGADPECT